MVPGLEKEFVQFANAFADWCNASGGINGRHIEIDNRDAALFNAAQVTSESCQSDFMAIGGGMALDQPSVPVREGCGLGQITGYTVSDAAGGATLQVNPSGINPKEVTGGWFAALAKKYPQAVKDAAMGAENNPSVMEPEKKYEDAAQAMGWSVKTFQTAPITVTDWAPYVQQMATGGYQAIWPSDDGNMAPYFQAMATDNYNPAFVILGVQFYEKSTVQGMAGLHLPPVYVETVLVAARDGLPEPLDRAAAPGDAQVREWRHGRLRRRGSRRGLAAVGQVRFGVRRQPHGHVRAERGGGTEELVGRRHRGAGGRS